MDGTLKLNNNKTGNLNSQNNLSEISSNSSSKLSEIKTQNCNKLIIGSLNINSISSKIDLLRTYIKGYLDILVVLETKIDESYPISQFSIDGFSEPFRLDRDKNGGGILVYVRQDIPSRILNKHTFPDDLEGIFIEINLR